MKGRQIKDGQLTRLERRYLTEAQKRQLRAFAMRQWRSDRRFMRRIQTVPDIESWLERHFTGGKVGDPQLIPDNLPNLYYEENESTEVTVIPGLDNALDDYGLTGRGREVAKLLTHGYKQAEIAELFGVGAPTVCKWVRQIRRWMREGIEAESLGDKEAETAGQPGCQEAAGVAGVEAKTR